ncbi:MAG: amidohydrolase family protein [Parvibaculaceae bacterium]
MVDRGHVAALGQGDLSGTFEETIDLSGHLVTPGLVNSHHHFFQSLTRAIPAAQRGHLLTWLLRLYPIWSRMTPDDLAAATEAAVAELLLSGVTTTSDHLYLVPRAEPDYVEAEIAAALGLGIRLNLVRGSLTALEADLEERLTAMLGPGAGGLIDDQVRVCAEMARVLRTHHRPGPDSRLTVALGPTTTTYQSLDYMRAVARLAREHDCGLHTHFHPRSDERAVTAQMFGKAPVDVLDSIGWLRPGTWIAHGTRLDAYDMARLAERGVALAHCPRMIMRLGARLLPLHEVRAAGIRVGIGVDGAASNDSGSMVSELRIAALLHRLAGGEGDIAHDDWMTPMDVLDMATRESAAVIGRPDLGRLEIGGPADIAAFDLRSVGYAGARTDPLSGFVLAGSDSRAALTMVAGRILVRQGTLVGTDEYGIRDKLDKATDRLIGEVSSITGWDYTSFESQNGKRPS